MIHLDQIARRFGGDPLFAGLDWRIDPGARLGLVGPNGAGKTTLLRILAALDTPDEGKVHRIPGLQVGYLPQAVETVGTGSVLEVALSAMGEIAELEGRLLELEARLAGAEPGDEDVPELVQRHGRLRLRFEALEGDRAEARAKQVLGGLGIAETRFERSVEELSGGWRMRVALARLLLADPDLLLLDEPTNHLDLDSIDWLEGFLGAFDGACICVSHDRYFLNRTVREVVALEHGRLHRYPGDYDDYLEASRRRAEALEQAARRQERQLAGTRRMIERFRYKASKARQVQSRLRALDKVEKIETAKQTRSIGFGFPPAPRSGDVVVRCEGLVQRYGDKVVYDGLDLLLRRGDRIALVGPNGAGKSTLLKLLAGRVHPDGGVLELGHKVERAYFAQHQLDELDPEATVLEEMERVAPDPWRPRLRGLLGRFLFGGDEVSKKVAVLSGGERARLALARLLLRPANLLLLDEPTNHLDLQSREVLEDALADYAGTLVVISHDRYFINRVATSIGIVGSGRLRVEEGDYDRWVEAAATAAGAGTTESVAPTGEKERRRSDEREIRRREAEERNRRYREERERRRRLEPLEREIESDETRREELRRQQASPEVYSDPGRAAEVGRELAELERRLRERYAEWERLAGD